MRLTLGKLRVLVREAIDCWGGSRPEEMYEQELEDDAALAKHSVIVPDDVKRPVSRWMRAMGLSGRRPKKRSRS